ncbi:hypothetical protein [Geoglobus acetivorans]|uniref:Pyridoxamine 5'-phosphate oxidase putative domain-containing protein n=1 Tax=Geoglobus acetivorans TaxID=565033 RepID=A0A0A7GHK2_GEOAI|nr:hypothetical protein GACE_1355 [Geoglobus acetivorans]
MEKDEILEMFNGDCSGRIFWVSTCGDLPHLAPVCFVKNMDGKVVVAYNFIVKTTRLVEETGKASIGFAERGKSGFYGYLVKGRAWMDYDGEYFREIRKFVEEKTGGKRSPRGALVIEPEEIYSLSPGNERKKLF